MKGDKKMNSIKSPEFLEGFKVARAECLDILFELEDECWGDRSSIDRAIRAQMEFAKELRKRIAALQPNIKTQK